MGMYARCDVPLVMDHVLTKGCLNHIRKQPHCMPKLWEGTSALFVDMYLPMRPRRYDMLNMRCRQEGVDQIAHSTQPNFQWQEVSDVGCVTRNIHANMWRNTIDISNICVYKNHPGTNICFLKRVTAFSVSKPGWLKHLQVS